MLNPYEKTAITEGWEPNINLCEEALEPLGICMKQVFDDNELPFHDDTFDVIINRHESYNVGIPGIFSQFLLGPIIRIRKIE